MRIADVLICFCGHSKLHHNDHTGCYSMIREDGKLLTCPCKEYRQANCSLEHPTWQSNLLGQPPHYGNEPKVRDFIWYVLGKAYKHGFLIPRDRVLRRMGSATLSVELWEVRRKQYKRERGEDKESKAKQKRYREECIRKTREKLDAEATK